MLTTQIANALQEAADSTHLAELTEEYTPLIKAASAVVDVTIQAEVSLNKLEEVLHDS